MRPALIINVVNGVEKQHRLQVGELLKRRRTERNRGQADLGNGGAGRNRLRRRPNELLLYQAIDQPADLNLDIRLARLEHCAYHAGDIGHASVLLYA